MKNRILFVSLAVVLAISVSLIGCGGEEEPEITEYNLTISSTEGGSVTTPGEGTFTYEEGEVVSLVAEAEEGYHFVEWSGDVSDVADVENATTTITMNDHYSITANFALETLEIWDWYDLDAIRDNLGKSYVLMNDLDSTTAGYEELASATAKGGKGWEPIGSVSVEPHTGYVGPVDPFTGSLDGQGYEIRDLFINRPDEDGVGLFGSLGVGGVVENLGMMDVAVTGHSHVGGLVGCAFYQNSYVSNSYSTGSVTGDQGVGGLVGWTEQSTVSNSYSTCSVTGGWRVGGLVGVNYLGGYVVNSYSTGSVTGDEEVGGLFGEHVGTVSNSFWDTETSGQSTSAGGTGKTTAEMQEIATFSGAAWDICAVNPGETNPTYTWNIVDGETYPFLSWQSVS